MTSRENWLMRNAQRLGLALVILSMALSLWAACWLLFFKLAPWVFGTLLAMSEALLP